MPRPSPAKSAAPQTYATLRALHPDAHCELDHRSPFELLVATVLSAQTTDKAVNQVTPALFARFPDAASLARAEQDEVEGLLGRLGMFRQKAKNLVGLSRLLEEKHGGEVPRTMAELTELPGVGRKTANVVMGTVFDNAEGVVVDTHVQRLTQRLGWSKKKDPVEIERELMKLFAQPDYALLSHTLIFHGRRICAAAKPACGSCALQGSCPSAGKAEKVGRKPPRERKPSAVAQKDAIEPGGPTGDAKGKPLDDSRHRGRKKAVAAVRLR